MKKIIIALSILVGSSAIAQAQTLDDAIKLYNYNKYNSAMNILKPLSATNAQANFYLGLCELALDKPQDALVTFNKFKDDLANQSGIARVMITQKKNTEAMAILNAMTAKVKKKEYLPYKYAADAITYTYGADFNKAVEWYKLALDKSQDPDLYIGMGDAYFYLPNGGGNAMSAWENALMNKPKNPGDVYFRIGELWYSARNYDSALWYFDKVKKEDPQNPLPYQKLANSYNKQNKLDLAKENMEQFLKLSDKSIADMYTYINILFNSKDYRGSINKINELMSSGSSMPYLYRLLGYAHYELGDIAQAKSNMDQFFAKQDKSKVIPSDYEYYGKILSKTPGNEALAEEYFDKALDAEEGGNKVEKIRKMADDAREADDFKAAAKSYCKIVDKYTAQAELLDYYWAGVCQFFANDYANARTYVNKTIEKFPTEPSSYYWLGRIGNAEDKDAKLGTAEAAYKKFIEMSGAANMEKKSELGRAYDYLIYYYYQKGDTNNAKDYANKQLAINPTNEYAKKVLANLNKK